MNNKLYRILIVVSIVLLVVSYLTRMEIILYIFAISLLLGHALNHWNENKS